MVTTPGAWMLGGSRDWRYVLLTCPLCRQGCVLRHITSQRPDGGKGHTIEADGKVHPSVVCPHDGCTYHEWVTLADWDPSIEETAT